MNVEMSNEHQNEPEEFFSEIYNKNSQFHRNHIDILTFLKSNYKYKRRCDSENALLPVAATEASRQQYEATTNITQELQTKSDTFSVDLIFHLSYVVVLSVANLIYDKCAWLSWQRWQTIAENVAAETAHVFGIAEKDNGGVKNDEKINIAHANIVAAKIVVAEKIPLHVVAITNVIEGVNNDDVNDDSDETCCQQNYDKLSTCGCQSRQHRAAARTATYTQQQQQQAVEEEEQQPQQRLLRHRNINWLRHRWTALRRTVMPTSSIELADRRGDKLQVMPIFMTLFIALTLSVRCVAAGACWQKNLQNGKCNEIFSLNITKAECCSTNQEFSFTDRELSSVEYFFATAIGGGMECVPCLESCKNVNCGPNKKCAKRKGRPKCICAPECGAATRRRQRGHFFQGFQQQQPKHHSVWPYKEAVEAIAKQQQQQQQQRLETAVIFGKSARDIRSLSSEIQSQSLDVAPQGGAGAAVGRQTQNQRKYHVMQRQRARGVTNRGGAGEDEEGEEDGAAGGFKENAAHRLLTTPLMLAAEVAEKPTTRRLQLSSDRSNNNMNNRSNNKNKNKHNHNDNKHNNKRNKTEKLHKQQQQEAAILASSNNSNAATTTQVAISQSTSRRKNNNKNNANSNILQTAKNFDNVNIVATTAALNGDGDDDDVADVNNAKLRHIHQNSRQAAAANAPNHDRQQQQQQQQQHRRAQHHGRHQQFRKRKKKLQNKLKDQQPDSEQQSLLLSATVTMSGTAATAAATTTTVVRTTSTTPANSSTSADHQQRFTNHGSIFATSSSTAMATASATTTTAATTTPTSTTSARVRLLQTPLRRGGGLTNVAAAVDVVDDAALSAAANVGGNSNNNNNHNRRRSKVGNSGSAIVHADDMTFDDRIYDKFNLHGFPSQQQQFKNAEIIKPHSSQHQHHHHPVCGTDGRTYNTECQLKKRACRTDNTELIVAYQGHCKTSCNGVKCLHGLACVEDHYTIPHCIACRIDCPLDDAADAADDAIDVSRAVCGIDGKTYRSVCDINRMICRIGRAIGVAYPGPCRDDRVTCSDINCGPKRSCLMDLLTHEPRCVSCRYKCSRKRRPAALRFEEGKICGANNRTYNSWCEMRKDSCATGYFIDVKAIGECH